MATLRDIKRRIRSVKNIAQSTRALQLVASSKMRRAQERVLAARPYANELQRLLSRLALAGGLDEPQPLMQERPLRNLGVVLVSPDRGFCGALPGNLNRHAAQTVLDELRAAQSGNGRAQNERGSFVAIGRKGRDFVLRTGQHLLGEFVQYGDQPDVSLVRAIARVATDAYLNNEVDRVDLIYAKFISTASQQPVTVQLLPVQPPTQTEEGHIEEYIFEPDPATLFAELLPRYVETLIYQAILESLASQWSAQMVAMKNATDNATELVGDLTLTYNKARQQAITTQILEVVAGASQ
ncbi:MAG TPA: ATP synthase F1 subunit gamma [Ktedonobacterales bacterium]|jgi:F-type H+-transporting ATPase subunit gamma